MYGTLTLNDELGVARLPRSPVEGNVCRSDGAVVTCKLPPNEAVKRSKFPLDEPPQHMLHVSNIVDGVQALLPNKEKALTLKAPSVYSQRIVLKPRVAKAWKSMKSPARSIREAQCGLPILFQRNVGDLNRGYSINTHTHIITKVIT